ncbi:MAG: MOSC domain-containing protein [Neorhizobium sp.]|jgi:MOSC domain-containing protein YiiM|nr:MOSC domain-containing protein [Neorhizobium sp.]
MKLLAICLGTPQTLPGKSAKTGILKSPVSAPVMIDAHGLVGDAVCNRKHHGGPDQAILIEGSQTLQWWARELGRDLPYGTFGENLVIDGLDDRDIAVGDRFHIGEVLLEATLARIPCNTFAVRMGDPGLVRRYFRADRPGIYCRVLSGGMLTPGDPVTVEPYQGDRIPISELLASAARPITMAERDRYLAAPIGERLRKALSA